MKKKKNKIPVYKIKDITEIKNIVLTDTPMCGIKGIFYTNKTK